MAFCTKCGAQNPDGVGACGTCAAPMGVNAPPPPAAPQYAPPAAPQYAPPGAPVMYQQPPAGPAQPNMLVTMFNGLDIGEKIAGIGGLVAAVAFFLPWTSGYAGLYGGGTASANGMDAAKTMGSVWLAFLLPLVAVGLVYFAYNNDLRTKIIVAAAHCAIGVIMLVLFFSGFFSSGQFGWLLSNFGLVAISVGGFMSIFALTKRLAGVR